MMECLAYEWWQWYIPDKGFSLGECAFWTSLRSVLEQWLGSWALPCYSLLDKYNTALENKNNRVQGHNSLSRNTGPNMFRDSNSSDFRKILGCICSMLYNMPNKILSSPLITFIFLLQSMNIHTKRNKDQK